MSESDSERERERERERDVGSWVGDTRERERCGESGLEGGGRSGEERNEVGGVCALDR